MKPLLIKSSSFLVRVSHERAAFSLDMFAGMVACHSGVKSSSIPWARAVADISGTTMPVPGFSMLFLKSPTGVLSMGKS